MMSSTASPSVIPILLFQTLAGANVEDSRREKYHRSGNENEVKHEFDSLVPVSWAHSVTGIFRISEFDENRQVDAILNLPQIWSPQS